MAPVAEPWPGSGITPPFDAYNPRLGADGDRLATICNIYKKSSDDHDGGDDLRPSIASGRQGREIAPEYGLDYLAVPMFEASGGDPRAEKLMQMPLQIKDAIVGDFALGQISEGPDSRGARWAGYPGI